MIIGTGEREGDGCGNWGEGGRWSWEVGRGMGIIVGNGEGEMVMGNGEREGCGCRSWGDGGVMVIGTGERDRYYCGK